MCRNTVRKVLRNSRNVLNVIWSIMNVCVYVSLWLYVFKCICVSLVLFMLPYFSLDLVILVRFRNVGLSLAMFCYQK